MSILYPFFSTILPKVVFLVATFCLFIILGKDHKGNSNGVCEILGSTFFSDSHAVRQASRQARTELATNNKIASTHAIK